MHHGRVSPTRPAPTADWRTGFEVDRSPGDYVTRPLFAHTAPDSPWTKSDLDRVNQLFARSFTCHSRPVLSAGAGVVMPPT